MKQSIAAQVRAVYAADPDLPAAEVARRLKTTPGTIRTYKARFGLSRPRGHHPLGQTTQAILDLLRQDDRLTMREIMDKLGLSTTSVVRAHLLRLRAAGIITYENGKARSIRVLK